MEDPARTEFATRAFDVAKMFGLFVADQSLSDNRGNPLAIDLTTPHGMSTGHGTQSLQHITIAQGTRFFVIGSVDPVRYSIEFRSLSHAASLYQQRWNEQFPLSKATYDVLFKRIQSFASSQQYVVVVKDIVEPQRPRSRPLPRFFSLTISLVLAVVAAVATYFLVR
jgi:hypothetical protein